MTVLLATHNQGKAREFSRLLELVGITVKTLSDFGVTHVPEETGKTFLENAHIKAEAAMEIIKLPTLADDSGLCVDVLHGAPGIDSANYNIDWLLQQMEGKPNRAATFVCQLVLLYPDGRKVIADGKCEGEILHSPRGIGGFGYDPVFFVPEKGCTMAEMSTREKNLLSHRSKAIKNLMRMLPK